MTNADKSFEPPVWKKNEPLLNEFEDGKTYIVALRVVNNVTGTEKWEIDKIRVHCDAEYFEMVYADCADNTLYDAWTWDDFEYYIEVKQ